MIIDKAIITVCFVAALGGNCSLLAQAQHDTRTEILLHHERGQTALRANQLETAAEEFRQILRLDAKSASAYANLGLVAFKQGKYAQAAESLSVAVKLNPALW